MEKLCEGMSFFNVFNPKANLILKGYKPLGFHSLNRGNSIKIITKVVQPKGMEMKKKKNQILTEPKYIH